MRAKEEGITSIVAHAISRLGVKSTSSVLVATSGGVDSMSLAFILNDLRKKGHLKKLALIHINHGLRGKESDKDELLVKQFAGKLRVPIQIFSVDTNAYSVLKNIGTEEAARTLRYDKIAAAVTSKKFDFVATAHTANDQAETVLMNIVRGAGLNGLQGIPESRKITSDCVLIRPLLGVNKSELRAFAAEKNIPYREDASNDSLDFQRNRLRHQVFPALEKAYKDRNVYSGFAKMSRNIASVAAYIENEVRVLRAKAIAEQPSYFPNRKIVSLDRKILHAAPDFLRRELITREASALSEKLVSLDHIRSLLLESFLEYPSEKSFALSKEVVIAHDGKYVTIENIDTPPVNGHDLIIGKRVKTPAGFIAAKKVRSWDKPGDSNCAYFKFSDLEGRRLRIRYWKQGDRIQPFGMKGKSRLVSDILSEAGIKSRRLKYFVPVVVFQDEPEFILWIPGIRSAEFGRLSAKSETALELRRII
ncbi:MAG: tRNA lysidine(34) synthetase TilS [Bacteroidota bacterium]|nr:tRNA lysidine(34) synthetase TilS [Bacteroidota bacterium]MDP4229894.1 tRNA lysidine(34) synthetase TilS [Bacteroidota bacterium]MDP4236859.1 tRNA lysidine(34) synthetase TilS [Bacteroidota bacterium]